MSAAAADLGRRGRAGARPRARRLGAVRATVVLLLVGGFLAGIVALNVAALRANMRAGAIQADTRRTLAKNGQLEAELARLRSGERIAKAAARAGMVIPPEYATRTLGVRAASRGR